MIIWKNETSGDTAATQNTPVTEKTNSTPIDPSRDDRLEVLRSVTFVGFQKENWGQHSGANSILNLLTVRRFFLSRPVPGVVYRLSRPFKGFFRKRNDWYEINSAYLEFRVACDWFRQRNHIYHFLSGENEYLFSGGLKRSGRNNRIVCTYHAPQDEYVRTVFARQKIQNIDAAVVVASNMLSFFESLLGPGRVWQIPHGVDTSYWQPASEQKPSDAIRILFVGSHFRDFDVLKSVIQIVTARDKSISFDAVVSKSDAAALSGFGRVRIHSQMDEAELLGLYQRSDIFICPLLECTASNSLLEAMACGVPIVATQIGGVHDYINDRCAVLTEIGNEEAMAEATLHLAADEKRRRIMGVAGRHRALELDWRVIALQLAELYRHLLTA